MWGKILWLVAQYKRLKNGIPDRFPVLLFTTMQAKITYRDVQTCTISMSGDDYLAEIHTVVQHK